MTQFNTLSNEVAEFFDYLRGIEKIDEGHCDVVLVHGDTAENSRSLEDGKIFYLQRDLTALSPDGYGDVCLDIERSIGGLSARFIVIGMGLDCFIDPSNFLRKLSSCIAFKYSKVVVQAINFTNIDFISELATGNSRPVHEKFGKVIHPLDFRDFSNAIAAAELTIVAENYDGSTVRRKRDGFHPLLRSESSFAKMFREFISGSNPRMRLCEFIAVCIPSQDVASNDQIKSNSLIYTDRVWQKNPIFLTIIVRTQGRRNHTLAETLLSLCGQTCQEFEVLLLGHKLSADHKHDLEQMIDDLPGWFRKKLTFQIVSDGNRTRPLNEGFSHSRGRYVCYLDDDDVAFSHYVETFKELSESNDGKILRALAVTQEVENYYINDRTGLAATSGIDKKYMEQFDLFVHLRLNQSPFMTLAFPSELFFALGLRFDENLSTTEDWDFLLRSSSIVGVASSRNITSVYRWWTNAESSRTAHSPEEWDKNRFYVYEKLDSINVFFPPGTTARIRYLLNEYDRSFDLRSRNTVATATAASGLVKLYAKRGAKRKETRSLIDAFIGLLWKRDPDELSEPSDAELVMASGLFDENWYLEQNPDVEASGMGALKHYLNHGGLEGRPSGPHFNSAAYLHRHSDVREACVNPLVHYLRSGLFEGRSFSH